MLAMVIAEDTILLLLGWEIMGLCSFMLIGHWWEDGANSRAALKAFFTVRTGDMGLLIGISILYFAANDWTMENLGVSGFSIRGLSAWALSGDPNSTVILVACVALFIAAIGKSGQFPLHTWLPDAMAGPTPVSSLLHSSTMVVAGVFLVARLYPVFFTGFDILGTGGNFITVIGTGIRAERHQEGACVFDRFAARLHDARSRRWCMAAGRVPHFHPRVF
jgi:NADH-quinone oxidoreductase subunit L